MTSWTRVVESAHVATMVTLVGTVAVDPTARLRGADDWSGWLSGQQRVDRVMSRVAPPLFLSTTAAATGAALVAVRQHRRSAAAGRSVAAVCTALAVAVTLVVNEPANAQVRGWRPADQPPDDWRAVRARWDQAHRVRRILVAAAGAASLWGVLSSQGARR